MVEVIPSGLWLRGPEPPRHADRIRAVPMDPDRVRLVVDDPAPAVADRHRELAGDLAARLDPATRQRAAVQPSSLVAPGRPGLSARGSRPGRTGTRRVTPPDCLPRRRCRHPSRSRCPSPWRARPRRRPKRWPRPFPQPPVPPSRRTRPCRTARGFTWPGRASPAATASGRTRGRRTRGRRMRRRGTWPGRWPAAVRAGRPARR
ncbi:hypothetical protein V2I01_32505 [Micromonospora sp. BRA006-A]|nr:hypothetical protein [Micromonospora sp. BRA006-A]